MAWRKSIEALDKARQAPRTLAQFPEDRCEAVVEDDESVVRLKLSQLRAYLKWGEIEMLLDGLRRMSTLSIDPMK